MIGYKAFDKNLTCIGYQYEIGKTYELAGELSICNNGFHFCKNIADTYDFYPANKNTRICKVEALGDIISSNDTMYCTNKIKILEEITEDWERKGNTDSSSNGYSNAGYANTGDSNTGNYNTGNHNAGNYNAGDYNVGDSNIGNHNAGDYNVGDYNTGNNNGGNYNAGHHNLGDKNIGDSNRGHENCGIVNRGNRNTGNYNTGNYNAGDFNIGDYNIGCFNLTTGTAINGTTIRMFNKESGMSMTDWLHSKARVIILSCMPKPVDWAKLKNYLKTSDKNADAQIYWDDLSEEDKNEVLSLPNFDKEIFKKCTGIEVGDAR